jgi:hypothetical protein
MLCPDDFLISVNSVKKVIHGGSLFYKQIQNGVGDYRRAAFRANDIILKDFVIITPSYSVTEFTTQLRGMFDNPVAKLPGQL